MSNHSEEVEDSRELGRRSVLKKGLVGGAAAGVIWSAPKVEGLTLRPNYALAMSPSSPSRHTTQRMGTSRRRHSK